MTPDRIDLFVIREKCHCRLNMFDALVRFIHGKAIAVSNRGSCTDIPELGNVLNREIGPASLFFQFFENSTYQLVLGIFLARYPQKYVRVNQIPWRGRNQS